MSGPEYFTIDTAVAPVHKDEIFEFILTYYLKPKPKNFRNIHTHGERNYSTLSFTAMNPKDGGQVFVRMRSGNPIKVEMDPDETASAKFTNSIKEDLINVVQFYHENVRQSTLYFSWIEGEKIIPEQPPNSRKKISDRLFGSNLLVIYIIFFGINVILFILLGLRLAIIAILAIQLSIVLLSDKIYTSGNNWNVTESNPYVHIMEYQLPIQEFQEFRKKFGNKVVTQMKKEIYDRTFAVGETPTCQLGHEVFENYGFRCNPEGQLVKKIDVYNIVKTAADKFQLPMPKIAISNTMVPNAAATGPSPKRGLVLITTGLLVELEENEILSVLGHEMGHLQGRDPIVLFSIIAIQFILSYTLLYPIFLISPIVYIILILALIFFVAKFFETRADLVSAMKIGHPELLAQSLRKIGFSRLQMERTSSNILSWISFDTHPPLYFRIERLENLKTPINVKHPLLRSAKDVFIGFKRSFGR